MSKRIILPRGDADISLYMSNCANEPVFIILHGDWPLMQCNTSRLMKLTIEANIPAVNSIRYSFATHMLFDTKSVGGIYIASKFLVHSLAAVTELHLLCTPKQLEQAILADPLGTGV